MFIQFIVPLLFQFILEGAALAYNSLIFLNINTKIKVVLLIACVHGGVTFLFRILPVSFMLHTLISFLIMTILVKAIYKINIIESFIGVLKSFIILGTLEIICINIFVIISGIKLTIIMNSPLLKTASVLPQIILLFVIGYIMKSVKKRKDEKEVVS